MADDSGRGGPPAPTGIHMREALDGDLPALTALQNALLATTAIEWTDEPHTPEERAQWLSGQRARGFPVLVAVAAGNLVGFASYSDFRDTRRWPGYRFTVEHTVHVAEAHWGRGVGRALMNALIERARAAGVHVMVGGVAGDNAASVVFHERLGFREVARMPEVGAKLGAWQELVFMQRILDSAPSPR